MPIKNLVIKPAQQVNFDTVKESQFYKGFSTVYSGKTTKLYDKELVKQDLINHFNTRKGERVMNPAFGTIIWDCIFDPLTETLREEIKNDVSRIISSDPRFSPTDVNIYEKDFGLLIEITLSYLATDESETLRLQFDKVNGLAYQ